MRSTLSMHLRTGFDILDSSQVRFWAQATQKFFGPGELAPDPCRSRYNRFQGASGFLILLVVRRRRLLQGLVGLDFNTDFGLVRLVEVFDNRDPAFHTPAASVGKKEIAEPLELFGFGEPVQICF